VRLVDQREQVGLTVDRFRPAHKQMSAFSQAVAYAPERPPLHFWLQVNQHVAATDQVQVRERGIGQEVLLRKHDSLLEAGDDAVVGVLRAEKPAQALSRHVGLDASGIASLPCELDGVLVDVGCKHLQVGRHVSLVDLLQKQNGERVCLFSCCTAWHPDPHRLGRAFSLDHLRKHLALEGLKRRRVSKEVCDRDQKILFEGLNLLLISPQQVKIRLQAGDRAELHPALQAPERRRPLVAREVVARLPVETRKNLLQNGELLLAQGAFLVGQLDAPRVVPVLKQLLCQPGCGAGHVH